MNSFLDTLDTWLHNAAFNRLVYVGLGIVVVIILTAFLKRIVNTNITNTDHRYRVRKAVNFIGYLLIVLITLVVYADKLGNLGVALGLAGAGITFALQEVIVSFAGWLNIILSGTPSVGQRVKIGEAKGDIIDIGVMKTTIMEIGDWVDGDLYNGRIITMANSYVFKQLVSNYSAEFPFLWDEIQVPVRTESDHALARKIFTDVVNDVCQDYALKSQKDWKRLANKFRVEEARVLPTVTLRFDENWITFTLRYIVDYKSRRSTKDRIYTALLDEIGKHENIGIATTTSEVTSIVKSDSN
ncbi:MAG: mechanosensitive ion channel [Flavobacteriales bacterium]|nr:mechanosensitive ion channel [Flavobacteriales bacterium]